MLRLKDELLKMEFPYVEDGEGQDFGEATWENTVGMIIEHAGQGYTLRRRNKLKLHQGGADGNRFKKNRWRTVHVVCEQGGKPDKRSLTGPANAPVKKTTKNTTTKKLGCTFQIAFNWAGGAETPIVSTATSLCLHHYVSSETGALEEHAPPRRLENEMPPEMIEEHEALIRMLHFQNNDTKAIYKTIQREGWRLGERGKQQVRTMRTRFEKERAASVGDANDAQQLLRQLQSEGCWMSFTLDNSGRINRIAWALDEQKKNALRYYPLIIQDNTFNTNQYKYHLALIVVVDKENYTHIAMQALLSSERTEDFEFLFREFRSLIGGAQPEVIFTDNDAAAMAAIEKESPASRGKVCVFHMDENLRKHGKGLGEGVLAAVIGLFHKAAYSQTEEMFLQRKEELFKLLDPGSHMYTYMTEYVFSPKWVQRWAKYVHPGLPTLGISSTQRVESTNGALKPAMTRTGTMVDVHRAISGKVSDDVNKTKTQTTGGPIQRVRVPTQSSFGDVRDSWLADFKFVHDGMLHAGCSAFAMKDMSDEALAAVGYSAETLATGNDDVHRLLTDFVANPPQAGLLYETDVGDVTLATRTSIEFFAELLRDQVLDRLVRVSRSFGDQTKYCQLVALGPDGFFLCTCLRILVDGLGCRHALRAMRGTDLGFTGACIAPRWRDGIMPWTMGRLAAKPAVVATTDAGVPGEIPPPPADASAFSHFSHSKSTVRASAWASCCAWGKELATITAPIDNVAGITRILDNLTIHARQLVDVELRSQHNASTTRVFKGVVTRSTPAADPPEGGGVGMTPSGDSGKRKHGATARGGGRGRGRGRSAGRGGRGGAGAVVPAVGVPSPGGGLPALQQAAGANATSGGGGEGRACVSAGGRPTGAISAGGGASPFQSLSNAPRGGVRQALLGLASTAFDSASSCAPENFQQSRLNGAMWQSVNHGHPLPPAPDQLAVLEDVQAPQRQKHTGPSKRRTSTRQRDARGGGQHVIQGGAAGAWGGQGGAAGSWGS